MNLDELSPEELRAVLLHEALHIEAQIVLFLEAVSR